MLIFKVMFLKGFLSVVKVVHRIECSAWNSKLKWTLSFYRTYLRKNNGFFSVFLEKLYSILCTQFSNTKFKLFYDEYQILLMLRRNILRILCMSFDIFFHLLTVWQYGLWSFQTGGRKLERFLPKNQQT